MAKNAAAKPLTRAADTLSPGERAGVRAKPSSLLDTRVIYCGDCLDQLRRLPDACVDLIYIDPPAWTKPLRRGEGPPFNSNRNYEVFWGETRETRAFEDRHASTQAESARTSALIRGN